MAKCAILIDGGYLDKVMANDFSGARVDIGKLGDELAAPDERLRTYLYDCRCRTRAILQPRMKNEDTPRATSIYPRLRDCPVSSFGRANYRKSAKGSSDRNAWIL